MSRKIILIKQELLLLVYELNRSGLLAENEKIRHILAQLEKLLLCDLSTSTFFFQEEDGIRCLYVTGVQTCALPISSMCETLMPSLASAWISETSRAIASVNGEVLVSWDPM